MRTIPVSVLLLAWTITIGCSPASREEGPPPPAEGATDKVPAPDPGPVDKADEVLATVNGTPITRADVDFWLLGGHGKKVTPEMRQQALEHRIEMELLYQRGIELGLDREPKYRAALRQQELRLEASRRKEMARRVGNREIAAAVRVTEEEARKYFDLHAEEIRSEVRLGALTFLTVGAAEKALRELEAGKSFEQLAQGGAKERQGSPKKWDLGFLGFHQIPAEWAEAIATLEPGQSSGIVHGGRTGIRILKLIERRPNPEIDFAAVKGAIMNRLRDQKVKQQREEYLSGLRIKAAIVYAQPE